MIGHSWFIAIQKYTLTYKIRIFIRYEREKSEKNTYEGWHKQVRDREGEEKRSNGIMP